MYVLGGERLKRCVECPKLEHCVISDPRLADMDPGIVESWLDENCPHRPSIRFAYIGR